MRIFCLFKPLLHLVQFFFFFPMFHSEGEVAKVHVILAFCQKIFWGRGDNSQLFFKQYAIVCIVLFYFRDNN